MKRRSKVNIITRKQKKEYIKTQKTYDTNQKSDKEVYDAIDLFREMAPLKYKKMYGIYGNFIRLNGINEVFRLGIDTTNTICTTFKVYNENKPDGVIYAFLYTTVDIKKNAPNISIRDITHKYCTTGPSMISKDGEYRSEFHVFRSLGAMMVGYPEVWGPISGYLGRKVAGYGMHIGSETYFPTDEYRKYKDVITYDIMNNYYGQKLYVWAWIRHTLKASNDMIELNINNNYKTAFAIMLDNDVVYLSSIYKANNPLKMRDLFSLAISFS